MRFSLSVCLCGVMFAGVFGGHKVLDAGLSKEEKIEVVRVHNDYRLAIAKGSVKGLPMGTNLLELKYDEILTEEAQKIADTGKFEHCTVKDERWAVGQNMYLTASTGNSGGADWATAITRWFEEYVLYTYSPCCTSGTGHFTQVIWADTQYVGCGYLNYEANDSYPYKKMYVCNYGPAGNIVGAYPYENGTYGSSELC